MASRYLWRVPAAASTPSNRIRYCRGADIDRQAWDDCVRSASSVPYGLSWYLDLTAEARWDGLVLDRPEGGYRAVFPLPWRRKLGIPLVYTPFFVQQLGLFARTGEREANSPCPPLRDWLAAIPSSFRKVQLQGQAQRLGQAATDADAADLGAPEAYPESDAAAPDPLPKGWSQRTRLNLLLPLASNSDGLDGIRRGYSSNLKRNLNKARKAQLEVREALDPAGFVAQFRAEQGPQIPELGPAEYARMERILQEGQQRQAFYALEIHASASLADAGTNAEAGGPSGRPQQGIEARLCFWKGPRGPLFLFGSSTQMGRKYGAMALGFDHAIGHFCGVTNAGNAGASADSPEGENKPQILDFEGSTREGLARFYRGFGAVEEYYPVWERGLLGSL